MNIGFKKAFLGIFLLIAFFFIVSPVLAEIDFFGYDEYENVGEAFEKGGDAFNMGMASIGYVLGEDGVNFVITFALIFVVVKFLLGSIGKTIYKDSKIFKGLDNPLSIILGASGAGFVYFNKIDVFGFLGPNIFIIAGIFGIMQAINAFFTLSNKGFTGSRKALAMGVILFVAGIFASGILPLSAPGWAHGLAVLTMLVGFFTAIISLILVIKGWFGGKKKDKREDNFDDEVTGYEGINTEGNIDENANGSDEDLTDAEKKSNKLLDDVSKTIRDLGSFSWIEKGRYKKGRKDLIKLDEIYRYILRGTFDNDQLLKDLGKIKDNSSLKLIRKDDAELEKGKKLFEKLKEFDKELDEKNLRSKIFNSIAKNVDGKYKKKIKKGKGTFKIWVAIYNENNYKDILTDIVNKSKEYAPKLDEIKNIIDSSDKTFAYSTSCLNKFDEEKEKLEKDLRTKASIKRDELLARIQKLYKMYNYAMNFYIRAKRNSRDIFVKVAEYEKEKEQFFGELIKQASEIANQINSKSKDYKKTIEKNRKQRRKEIKKKIEKGVIMQTGRQINLNPPK